VHDHALQIIGLAEFWCSSFIDDAEVYLNGYNLFHDDRPSGIGGGVLQYFTYIFHCQLYHVLVLSDVGFENSLWFLIKFSSTEVLFVGVVYRAPSLSNITTKYTIVHF